MHRVEKVLERIAQPPPSPVAAKILAVVQDENAGARSLAEVITKDPAFTARILRIVNSAYYGLSQRVTTVSRAVSVLGFDTIKSLALTLYTFGPLGQDKDSRIGIRHLWEHSLGCAVGARRITAQVGHTSPEEAFVVGLLHDIGKVLFYQFFKKEFVEAVRMAEEEGISLSEAESQTLGVDHAAAGEAWARKWNLPPIIQSVIRSHHHPLLLPEEVDLSVRQTAVIVHIADLFCEASQIGKGGDSSYGPIEEEAWPLLGIKEEECRELLEPVAQEVQEIKELFGLAPSVSSQQPTADEGRRSAVGGQRSGNGLRPQPPSPASPQSVETHPERRGEACFARTRKDLLSANGQGSEVKADGSDCQPPTSDPQLLLGKFSRLMEAGKQVALLAGLEDFLPNIASQAQALMEADAAGIFVSKGDSLEVVEAVGLNGLVGRTVPVEGSLVGWVAKMGEPVVIANIAEAPDSWEKEFFGPAGYLSHLLLPVEWAGKRIAILSIHSRSQRHWSPQEMSLFNTFMGLVAVAMENAQLYREAEERATTLEKLNQELKEALSLRKKFLAIVSHELRTPFQAILGYTQLILTNTLGQPSAKMKKALEKVLKQANHLLGMINSLLDLSQIEVGKLTLNCQPVNPAELLGETATLTTTLLQDKPVVLRCEYDPNLPTLFTDRQRLRQIFDHLLDNAVKFTAEGEIVLQAYVKTNGVEMAVRDTGIGIEVENQKVIFEGFRQIEDPHTRRYGGVGVGLYMARSLVELLGGTITVESEVGQGSTFRVWVPNGRSS